MAGAAVDFRLRPPSATAERSPDNANNRSTFVTTTYHIPSRTNPRNRISISSNDRMMHPIDDDNSNNEQEVVFDAICVDFDDDEDDDENDHPRSPTRPNDSTPRLHTTSTSNNNTSNDRNNSPLLTHFQPLLENSVAAHVAANDLEVFLSSNPDDDTAIVAPQRIDPTITRIQTYNSSNRVSSSTLAAPDDDDDDNLLYLSSPTPPTLTTTIVPSHWQPLVASSPTPIVDNPEHKNNHLPSHYIVQNNVNNYNNQATPNSNISSSFLDPFAFPQHQQPHPDSTTEAATTNDASLMDFTSDDDDCNEGDLTTIRTPTNMNTMTTPLRNTHATHRMVPGSAGFLEMEEEPPRTTPHSSSHSSVDPEQTFATQQQQHQQAWTNSNGISINSNSNANSLLLYEPMQTSSGLLLTHRRLPPPSTTTPFPIPDQHHHHHHQHQQQPHSMRTRFEFDTASSRDPHGNNNPQQSLWSTSSFSNSTIPGFSSRLHPPHPHSPVLSLPPLLRTVRLSVLVSALVLLVGTVVLLHHSTAAVGPTTRHSNTNNNNKEWLLDEEAALDNNNDMQGIVIPLAEDGEYPDRIILLPLPEHGFPMPNNNKRNHNHHRRLSGPIVWEQTTNPDRLMGVPAFFEDTVEAKPLTSIRREDNRVESIHHRHLEPLQQINPLPSLRAEFEEWKDRHNKTYHSEKEGQHRFRIWSNNHHNTAAKNERHGPCLLTGKQVFGSNHFQDLTVDEFQLQYLTGYSLKREPVMQGSEPKVYPPILDPSVHVPNRHPEVHQRILQRQMSYSLNYQAGCKWYDVSCHLRYIFQTYFYGMGGTMEPRYDANSYPTGKSHIWLHSTTTDLKWSLF